VILQRLIQHLCPLDVCSDNVSDVGSSPDSTDSQVEEEEGLPAPSVEGFSLPGRSRRTAATEVADKILECVTD
jgi:hypothetical protein